MQEHIPKALFVLIFLLTSIAGNPYIDLMQSALTTYEEQFKGTDFASTLTSGPADSAELWMGTVIGPRLLRFDSLLVGADCSRLYN